jgi:hypothetical protein
MLATTVRVTAKSGAAHVEANGRLTETAATS